MRIFVLASRASYNSYDLDIENLERFGRFDIVVQSAIQAICISREYRKDVIFYAILRKPNKPISLEIISERVKGILPNEKHFAEKIRQNLEKYYKRVQLDEGFNFYELDLIPLLRFIKQKYNPNFFVLHEKGENLEKEYLSENNCFIVGDHIGLPKKVEKFIIREFNARKISLGSIPYLTSTSIAIINHFLDKLIL
ncbi:MAG: hypothetical protein QXL82_00060 [Candidatus Aenigmatarchaeota archaeon]